MSTYYLLSDHSIGPYVFAAGSIQSTADATPPGLLPVGWTPSNNVDPLDATAVSAFYANGPCMCSPRLTVRPPKTFWQRTPGANSGVMFWSLTGLGSGLAGLFTQNGAGTVS
jgi:hypothetical protein